MAKPSEQIIKEYPSRGRLCQFRFSKSVSYFCFHCGQNKTSKLIAIYDGDWDKMICNGCYGKLLSTYETEKK